jgi:hypothetical protein
VLNVHKSYSVVSVRSSQSVSLEMEISLIWWTSCLIQKQIELLKLRVCYTKNETIYSVQHWHVFQFDDVPLSHILRCSDTRLFSSVLDNTATQLFSDFKDDLKVYKKFCLRVCNTVISGVEI